MNPIFAQADSRTHRKLLTLRQAAQTDKAPRVALRLQALLLSADGHTAPQIARLLHVHRTRVHAWVCNWNDYGEDGIKEGHRSGRPCALTRKQLLQLHDIVESGPVAYGLNSGVWTSPVLAGVIQEEFAVAYHPGHVRKLLHRLGCSVQRPTTRLVQADPKAQNKWIRYTYPNLKNAQAEAAVIVYVDEASFRQCPTLHQTWAPLNCRPEIPTRGERNTQKILGSVSLHNARFAYRHQTEYFNHLTYLAFVQEVVLPTYYRRGHRIYLIQDNASYHTHPEVWTWFQKERRRLEVFPLPKYSPELNAQERLWHYTRREATHNRDFETPAGLCDSLFQTLDDVRQHPEKIRGLLTPFS